MQRITGLTAILVGLGVSLCSAMTPLITGGERILFVGNNMTGYAPPGVGGLDVAVRSVLASGSVNVTTECVALPGTGELSDVYAQGVATERIRNGDYDFVVLQGWLQPENYYDGARDAFVQSVRQFHQVIVSSGAKTMLYMTYPNVFQAFRPDVANYETVMNVTAQSYLMAANEVGGAPVAPVGHIFRTFVKAPPPGTDAWLLYEANVWNSGRPEPHGQLASQYGRLLEGYVFYKRLTGRSPIGLRQTFYPSADPRIDSALQYRAETVTGRWVDTYNSTGVVQHAGAAGYQVAGVPQVAPWLFLLDGSRYCAGARGMGNSAPCVLIRSDGRSGVRSPFTGATAGPTRK